MFAHRAKQGNAMGFFDIYNLIRSVGSLVLLSIGIFLVMKKLHGKYAWVSFVPIGRYNVLANTLEIPWTGVICAVLELLLVLCSVAGTVFKGENADIAIALTTLIIGMTLFVYRIRLYLRVIRVFGLKRAWVIWFAVMPWMPMIVIGIGKRFAPRRDVRFIEEWEAGTDPGAPVAAHAKKEKPTEGLSVEVRERTVKDFGKKRYLLKDIAMDIPNGSLVLLLGGSGSGKTTFVNAVIGYEQANATILLNGSDVYKDYAHMKYRIGFVPQQNLIRGNDTVIRTIDDAAQMRLPASTTTAERRKRVGEVLDLLGIAASKDGLVSKKSGGQLRRISIAMELVTDPELFVLDEPDSGLDGVIAREIFDKLRNIANEGRIVMVITHTPDRVIDLFDKVIVLARDSSRIGRLAFYGTPQEAREFFGRKTMEDIVLAVNRKDAGGEGLADEFIERFAAMRAGKGGEAQ